MAEGDGAYRARYYQVLKEQEQSEKAYAFQLDLLRRTLMRLAAAARGLDDYLDNNIDRLRETSRSGDGGLVIEQLERIQGAVDSFEQRRNAENTRAAKHLNGLLTQYLDLQIPADLKSGLKQFAKELPKRLSSYRQYPAALEDLTKLQRLVLDAASNPSPGFWQRLKGGSTLKLESQRKAKKGAEDNSFDIAQVQVDDLSGAEADPGQLHPPEFKDSEDNYELVSQRIALTLETLVENIKPNEVIKHKVDIVRHRLDRGLDWFALAVTLEEIRDILFLRYIQADEEFSDYLKRVKEELADIREALGGASDREQAQIKAADQFSETVSSRVGKIKKSIAEANHIDSLKKEVTEHISYIHDALDVFRQHRGPSSLSGELRSLIERVQSIESESQKTKEMLEEQRHKATHDSLTELPNREAWNERAYHELQRFKRYGRPLTMAVCDIDFFKKINDTYGHQAGDKVIRLIAKLIQTRLREVDFVARYGGEEFVVLMPETAVEDAFKVLEKIRAGVAKAALRFKDQPVQVTLSFGLAALQKEDSVESAFERADKALYRAKQEGRNRCIIA